MYLCNQAWWQASRSRKKLCFQALNLHFWRKFRRKASLPSFQFQSEINWIIEFKSIEISWISHQSNFKSIEFEINWISNWCWVSNQLTWIEPARNCLSNQSSFRSMDSNQFSFNSIDFKSFEFNIDWVWTQLTLKPIDFRTNWTCTQLSFKPVEIQIKCMSRPLNVKSIEFQTQLNLKLAEFQIHWVWN